MDEEVRKQLIDQLNELEGEDREILHELADWIIIKAFENAGYKDISNAWRAARKRVGFWYA